MTAVITGINENGSLSATSSVASATNVVYMEISAQSLKTASTKYLSSTFPLTDTVMNLTHIDDLVDSNGGANRGKQQALHQRDDQLPHFRVSWSAGFVGPQDHGWYSTLRLILWIAFCASSNQ